MDYIKYIVKYVAARFIYNEIKKCLDNKNLTKKKYSSKIR